MTFILVRTFLGITTAAFLVQAASYDYLDTSRCPKSLTRTRYLRASPWDVCYEFHMEETTWRLADGNCIRRGGRLVTIKEARIQEFLIRSLRLLRWPRRGVWIGANDRKNEMDWRWVTGEKVKHGYSNWASGQPSCGLFCFEDCAVMRWKERGRWHDYRCNWIEDYSFICEFKMDPPPTTPPTTTTTTTQTTSTSTSTTTSTTTTTTTPTTSTTTSTTTTTMTPEIIDVKVVKKLESHNLLHNPPTKNNSTIPSVISYGGSDARHGQVKQVESSSAGLTSGSVIGLVVGIIIGLSFGLCFIFLFLVRRRRRKQQIEEDLRVSYENPYYGEVPPPPPAAHGTNAVAAIEGKADDKESGLGCATGGCDEDSHYVSKKLYGERTHKDHKEDSMKFKQPPPPSPLHSRPKLVMNNYDTPPSFLTHKSGDHNPNRKSSDSMGGYKRMDRSRRKHRSGSKDEENQYTEVHCGVKYTYDVPRSQVAQDYANGNTAMACGGDDYNPYYNEEENMYESLEHLTTGVEERGPMDTSRGGNVSQDEDPYVNGVRENKYVPLKTEDNIYF